MNPGHHSFELAVKGYMQIGTEDFHILRQTSGKKGYYAMAPIHLFTSDNFNETLAFLARTMGECLLMLGFSRLDGGYYPAQIMGREVAVFEVGQSIPDPLESRLCH